MLGDVTAQLAAAIAASTLDVIGQDSIENDAQAQTGAALLQAFGGEMGFIYFEAATANTLERPADVLLAHPEVGVCIIEVKAYSLAFIQRVQGNHLVVQYKDQPQPSQINPFKQADKVLYAVRNRLRYELQDSQLKSEPLFTSLVAMPNISESEWKSAGFELSYPLGRMFFREHITNPTRLRQRLLHTVQSTLKTLRLPRPILEAHFDAVRRAVGDSDALHRARPPRQNINKNSTGGQIDLALSTERHITPEQQRLSNLPISGHPRLVRGVAGSGKSLVLTKLVARYLARQLQKPLPTFEPVAPPLRVAVLCFNRALVPMLRNSIEKDYMLIAHAPLPPESTLVISHMNGLMERHTFTQESAHSAEKPVPYIPISQEMKDPAKRAAAYREALAQAAYTPMYQAIFVDEGQDLEPEEYRLLLDLIQPDAQTGEKNLIIFYDDAQNLYARKRPNWRELGIDLARGNRAQIMKTCYRNSREIIEMAFNVLIGSAAPENQRAETRTYADINMLLQQDLVEDLGDYVRVKFTTRSGAMPIVRRFADRDTEIRSVAHKIVQLISEFEVRPSDILVIFKSEYYYTTLLTEIAQLAPPNLLAGFVLPYKPHDKDRYIFQDGHLTLSTVHGAKGYDAPIVFFVGADLFDTSALGRAAFYVGATRAKAMLYLSGVSAAPDAPPTLLEEALALNGG